MRGRADLGQQFEQPVQAAPGPTSAHSVCLDTCQQLHLLEHERQLLVGHRQRLQQPALAAQHLQQSRRDQRRFESACHEATQLQCDVTTWYFDYAWRQTPG
jgi:hypothetical protein